MEVAVITVFSISEKADTEEEEPSDVATELVDDVGDAIADVVGVTVT